MFSTLAGPCVWGDDEIWAGMLFNSFDEADEGVNTLESCSVIDVHEVEVGEGSLRETVSSWIEGFMSNPPLISSLRRLDAECAEISE